MPPNSIPEALLPGLNHLFQSCTVCIPTEYATLDETFSPGALELMGDWVMRHVKGNTF